MRKSLLGKKIDKNFKPLNIWDVDKRIYNDLGVLDLYPESKSEEMLEKAYSVLLEGEKGKRFNTDGEPYLITSYGRIISRRGRVIYPINYVSRITGEVKQYVNLYRKTYDLHELFVDAGFEYDTVQVVRLLRKYGELRMANHSPDLPF